MRPSSRNSVLLRAVIHQFVFLLFGSPHSDRRTSLRIVRAGFRNWENSRDAIENKKQVHWAEMGVKGSKYFLIYKYYVGHFHCELYLNFYNK
jgi:hypothetical protein